uniref:Uncharacterized protein n=1 Tax=Leersia perrieri TaxID=77586 RepID=A0A0D9VVA1_9ORYZ
MELGLLSRLISKRDLTYYAQLRKLRAVRVIRGLGPSQLREQSMEKEEKKDKETGEPLYIPFPDCIADDAGTAFVAGAAAGSVYHFFSGLRNSPCGHHLAGAAKAVRDGAPRVATRWAARLGVYRALSWATGREDDPLVSVASGAVTGALLRLRHGPLAVGRAALVGAATLAVVEMIMKDEVNDDDKKDRPPLPGMKDDNDDSDANPVLIPPTDTWAGDAHNMPVSGLNLY